MSRSFHEIVMEGPFLLVKGFLLGFLAGVKPEGRYFFHRRAGIRRDTFREFIKELFELENYQHLCLESDLVNKFKEASRLYAKVTGMEIKSVRKIKSAQFSFAYEMFNEELALKAKEVLESLPESVKVLDFHPLEIKENEGKGLESYAPLHDFTARGKGTVTGDFDGVIDLFLKIKRSEFADFVVLTDVKLELEE
ncbi:MAG TPA: hypothetical protein ENK44_10505 [Caldithrix abyssi]|uniref:Uncharacterized protein n=1 Tax=Caldithrix abyssi TaxID=187145 RepID=A0A7V4U175_CALAY|nr:hypothetical protein [Caldithrix abyssi]